MQQVFPFLTDSVYGFGNFLYIQTWLSQEFTEWRFLGLRARSTGSTCVWLLWKAEWGFLPVLSVEKPDKQKWQVLGFNSQTIFKRMILYFIFSFIYNERLAFMYAAVPAVRLVQNHALLHEETCPLKTEQSQRGDEKGFICPSSNFPLEREVNLCYQWGRKQFFLFIAFTLCSKAWQYSHNVALQQWKILVDLGDLHVLESYHVGSLFSYEKNQMNEKWLN